MPLGNSPGADGQAEQNKILNFGSLFPQGDSFRIPPARFQVFSNANNQDSGLAVDGNLFTGWGSGRGQEPGMIFQVDLNAVYAVNGFSLFLNVAFKGYPRGLEIRASADGTTWREVRAASFPEYAFNRDRFIKNCTYRFAPQTLRYLKLIQTGRAPDSWWAIYELGVTAPQVSIAPRL